MSRGLGDRAKGRKRQATAVASPSYLNGWGMLKLPPQVSLEHLIHYLGINFWLPVLVDLSFAIQEPTPKKEHFSCALHQESMSQCGKAKSLKRNTLMRGFRAICGEWAVVQKVCWGLWNTAWVTS